jgi:hypothetical protein
MDTMHVHDTRPSPPRTRQRGAGKGCILIANYLGRVTLGLLGITVSLTLGLLGCDSGGIGGSGQCGGASDADACVQINTIEPVYLGQTTSNVDVLRDRCTSGQTSTDEPFTDHNATVTISNTPLPGVGPTGSTSVTLQDFSIRYTLNACPAGATCPALDTLTVAPGLTVTIPPRNSVTITLPFVSLATKFEYASKGGSLLAYPSYSATYTITGTDAFHNSVSVRGSAQFTIGDFNNCSR